MANEKALVPGILSTSINSDIADGSAGTAFAIPYMKMGVNLAWTMVYTGSPSVVSFSLQISLDGTNYVTVDTTTDTSGCLRIVGGVVAKFVRLYCTTFTTAGAGNALGKILVQ